MTAPCEMGWLVLHGATDNQAVRHVVAHSDPVCGTHGDPWPCMSTDGDTAAVTTNDDTKEDA